MSNKETCTWAEYQKVTGSSRESVFKTSCGEKYICDEEGIATSPYDEKFTYCPYCGKELEIK